MTSEYGAKQKIKVNELGDLLTDCSSSAITAGFGPFFLGIIGIPLTLKKLNKFVILNNEIKVGLTVFGALGIAIYTAKRSRLNCEQKVLEKYEM